MNDIDILTHHINSFFTKYFSDLKLQQKYVYLMNKICIFDEQNKYIFNLFMPFNINKLSAHICSLYNNLLKMHFITNSYSFIYSFI